MFNYAQHLVVKQYSLSAWRLTVCMIFYSAYFPQVQHKTAAKVAKTDTVTEHIGLITNS